MYLLKSLTASPPPITTSTMNQFSQSQSPSRSFRDSPRAKARLTCGSSSTDQQTTSFTVTANLAEDDFDYSGNYALVPVQTIAGPPVGEGQPPVVGAGGDGEAQDPGELDLQDGEVVSGPKLEIKCPLAPLPGSAFLRVRDLWQGGRHQVGAGQAQEGEAHERGRRRRPHAEVQRRVQLSLSC